MYVCMCICLYVRIYTCFFGWYCPSRETPRFVHLCMYACMNVCMHKERCTCFCDWWYTSRFDHICIVYICMHTWEYVSTNESKVSQLKVTSTITLKMAGTHNQRDVSHVHVHIQDKGVSTRKIHTCVITITGAWIGEHLRVHSQGKGRIKRGTLTCA